MATISTQPDTLSPTAADPGAIDPAIERDPRQRPPLVAGANDFASVTQKVCRINEGPTPLIWYILFGISLALLGMFFALIGYLVVTGPGVWGNNQPVAWGFPIVNFVFWVGIGHAGTLISAILFLFRQHWRTSINRFAEAMTIFAVACAGIFPGIHVGRPWLAYWLAPYPNQMGMWPQFRSPLLWDVFAVGTYASVSLLFWYVGMIPDIATLRDRAKSKVAHIAYSILSLGWTGSARGWHRFERAYLLLAALATPLVLSVHSVVSFDFAVAQLPGWHTTIFPPFFVIGAVFGGFAMVLVLIVPARQLFGLQELITQKHLENMCKIYLTTGLLLTLGYAIEFFVAWYSGSMYERFAFYNRAMGPYASAFWLMIIANSVAPLAFFSKFCRTNPWIILVVATLGNVGMWLERYVIVIMSLTRDFIPTSWDDFVPTWVDIGMFVGSFGLFFTLFLLFIRFLPIVAMAEVKSVMPQAHAHHHEDHNGDNHDGGENQGKPAAAH